MPFWIRAKYPLALTLLSGHFASVTARIFTLEDYCVHMAAPPRAHVCIAKSGDHAVGFYYAVSSRQDCRNIKRDPAIRETGFTAIFNASEISAEVNFQLSCDGRPFRSQFLNGKKFNVAGTSSKPCFSIDHRGTIFIDSVAHAGRSTTDEGKSPVIFYSFWLSTNNHNLHNDLKSFYSLLSSVHIDMNCIADLSNK